MSWLFRHDMEGAIEEDQDRSPAAPRQWSVSRWGNEDD
jgi:hypothetical protein